MNYKLSAFADESSNAFSGQIDALKRNGFGFLEIRNLDGKNVTALRQGSLPVSWRTTA